MPSENDERPCEIAWQNGSWRASQEVGFGLRDWGTLQGAIAVERLRTIAGQPLDVESHLARFDSSCSAIGIERTGFDTEILTAVVEEICARSDSVGSNDQPLDQSVVVLASPGEVGANRPTVIVHCQPIPWDRLRRCYDFGEYLCVASRRNVPSACWSPQIKTRSRLQYYLADQEARVSAPADAVASGLLLDLDGFVTETSSANVLMIDESGLKCPPLETLLHGISLKRTLRLATQLSIPITYERISPEALFASRGVLLTGTTGCIWGAEAIYRDGAERKFPLEAQPPEIGALIGAWKRELNFDFLSQARQLAGSP